MPCLAPPPLPVPPKPPAPVTLPTFSSPPVNTGFCCSINLPAFPAPIPPLPPIPGMAAVMTTLSGYLKAVQTYYDTLGIVCPLQ
jgi:hypothetical protein